MTTFFHQDSRTQTIDLLNPLGLGSDHSGHSVVSSCDFIKMIYDILADSSGMNAKQSVLIMAQVPPCEAVIMSKAILFWRTAFLIFDEGIHTWYSASVIP